MNTFKPSRRPSVKQVKEWDLLYEDSHCRDWRGDENNYDVKVFHGYPFPDFYKVVVKPHSINKKNYSKLFYGESAHHAVVRFVADLGFRRIHEVQL